jgi:hypothetical protein
MISGAARDDLVVTVAQTCRSGLDLDELRRQVLPRLRRGVPVDALWSAAVDPATLLFTRADRDEIPAETGPYFVTNEFLEDDVNKWSELARDRRGVRTLHQATGGRPEQSARYCDIFRPLGLGDELRAVLRADGDCWGYLCLHREGPNGFSDQEARFVERIAASRRRLSAGTPHRQYPGRGRLGAGNRADRDGRIAAGGERGGRAMARRARRILSRRRAAPRAARRRR